MGRKTRWRARVEGMHLNADQVVEKTGHPIDHWERVLQQFSAATKHPRNVVGHLHLRHGLSRFWAHELMMWFQHKEKGNRRDG